MFAEFSAPKALSVAVVVLLVLAANLSPNALAYDDPDPCVAFQTQPIIIFDWPCGWNPDACCTDCAACRWADEVQLRTGAGRELISYDVCTLAASHCDVNGTFDLTMQLWSVDPTTGPNQCLPLEPIPGTTCTFENAAETPAGSPCSLFTCAPSGGAATGITLPQADTSDVFASEVCGIDFYVVVQSNDAGAWPSLTIGPPLIGVSPWYEYFAPVEVYPGAYATEDDSDSDGLPDGTWSLSSWDDLTDFDQESICTVPVGPCCYDSGGCDMVTEDDCSFAGGEFAGLNTLPDPHFCEDPDGDGFYNDCDNCPNVENADQADCNDDGQGDACEADDAEQDSDGDGCCNGVDGCPDDPFKCGEGVCGCGFEDIDNDWDGWPDCVETCPLDPNKSEPGCCGCGFADTDVDGDGYIECAPDADLQPNVAKCPDTCPNADDALFGPCEGDQIPTVSQWGLVVLALLLLAAAKIHFSRRPEKRAGVS